MRDRLISLAKEIQSNYANLREKALKARASNPSLVSKVDRISLSLSVCAVDGGLLAHRMHGADIVVARAVGVVFVYENSHRRAHHYYPNKNPSSEIDIKNSLEEHEALVFRSLIRLEHEISCAVSTLEKYSPNVLLMDGSLLPLPGDRPSEESELRSVYSEVISSYEKLYTLAKEKECLLCGVIKDSRSRKLSRDLGMNCSDSLLCNYLLEEGEKTATLSYFEERAPNKDIAALGARIKVFYLKPSKNDLPLRIEVLGGTVDIDYAASVVCSLSAISDNFAYPAVLVEADMCAALDPNEIESIESSLLSLSGMKPLRRNARPFR